MAAVVCGDTAMVRLLLEHGADANAANRAGATPLLWAAGDFNKTQLLLVRGANVNARASSGRTPLMVAASCPASVRVVKLLLEKGADARYGHNGYTVLMAAAEGGDAAVVRLLLAKGANVKTANRAGWTALHAAALQGNATITEELLKRGADVNARETFQGRTPLVWAAASGRGDVVSLLLDHGADANVHESFNGATPLIWAAASDHDAADVVQSLFKSHADPHAKDKHGDTALVWAGRAAWPRVVESLQSNAQSHAEAVPPDNSSSSYGRARASAQAVRDGIAILQRSAGEFLTSSDGCISCHHQSLPALALSLAKDNKIPVDEKLAQEQTSATTRILRNKCQLLLQGAGTPDVLDAGYFLAGLAASGQPRSEATDALVHFLALKQNQDGSWRPTFYRPPMNVSPFTATALSVHGLVQFAPPGRKREMSQRIDKARAWLQSTRPNSTEDYSFQLLGLLWAGASPKTSAGAATDLLSQQRPDGGWAQLPHRKSDAYATGLALVALRRAAVLEFRDQACRRGAEYLLKTQCADGSWFVESRSLPIQPYFESGFPHGRSQFIACAATSWATMALMLATQPDQRHGLETGTGSNPTH
jgi:N-acyl-D-amino-acid deacylase